MKIQGLLSFQATILGFYKWGKNKGTEILGKFPKLSKLEISRKLFVWKKSFGWMEIKAF